MRGDQTGDFESVPPSSRVLFSGMTDADKGAARDYLPDAPPEILAELHAYIRDSAPRFSDNDEQGEWSVQIATARLSLFYTGMRTMADEGILMCVLEARIAAREAEARTASPEIALRPSGIWRAISDRFHRGKPQPI